MTEPAVAHLNFNVFNAFRAGPLSSTCVSPENLGNLHLILKGGRASGTGVVTVGGKIIYCPHEEKNLL